MNLAIPPAGDLCTPVQLYDVPGTTADTYGQVSDTAALIGTFRAAVVNLRGRELIAAQQAYTAVSHKVTLPWLGSAIPSTAHNPDRQILPRMYLILPDGSRLDVIAADNVDKRNRMWVLTCNEIVAT